MGPALSWLILVAACSEPVAFRGLVEERAPERGEVLISHEGIPDRVPAETAWFVVSDASLLAEMSPGRLGIFGLSSGRGRPEIESFEFLRWAREEEGWVDVGGERIRARRAPPFALEDERGRIARLADWQGRIVLLDFIYNRCPGPCPAQTRDHVHLQRELSEQARGVTQFLSITLEPEFDDGSTLRAYGEALGVDFGNWSLLTGDPQVVHDVIRRWGIGSTREGEEEILHTLYTFLIDDRGYIVGRYNSEDRPLSRIREDLERFSRLARGRQGA